MAISGGAIKAGRAFVELSTDNRQLHTGLKAAGTAVKGFSLATKAALISTGVGAIVAALGAALGFVTKMFSDADMKLLDLNQQFGISVEELSKLRFAAKMGGTDIETLTKGFAKLNDAVEKGMAGDGGALDQFDKLGVSVEALSKMNVEDRFKALADSLRQISDPSQRLNIAQKLLGEDDGRKLMTVLNMGSEGIDKLKKNAEQFGLVVGTDQIEKTRQIQAAWTLLWETLQAQFMKIMVEWAPVILRVLEGVANAIIWVMDKLKPVFEVMVSAISELAALWDNIFGTTGTGGYIKLELPDLTSAGVGDLNKKIAGGNQKLRKPEAARDALSAAMGTFNPWAISQSMRVGSKDFKDQMLERIAKYSQETADNTSEAMSFS